MTKHEELTKTLIKLNDAFELDAFYMQHIDSFCLTAYRMGASPLTMIRQWLNSYKLDIQVHYIQVPNVNKGTEAWLAKKAKTRTGPTFLVLVHKSHGFFKKVEVYYHSGLVGLQASKYPRLRILSNQCSN